MVDEKIKRRETAIALSFFDWVIQKRILDAMKIVQEAYEMPPSRHTRQKPVWRVDRLASGAVTFAYDGSPDKGFVIVDPDYTVRAIDHEGILLMVFR